MSRVTHRTKRGYCSTAKRQKLIEKLGRYEDTGLEPEQIEELKRYANVTEYDFE